MNWQATFSLWDSFCTSKGHRDLSWRQLGGGEVYLRVAFRCKYAVMTSRALNPEARSARALLGSIAVVGDI